MRDSRHAHSSRLRRCGLCSAAVCAVGLALLAGCGSADRPAPPAAERRPAEVLVIGRPVEVSIERGQVLEFEIASAAGQFVQVAFDSSAVDVELSLRDADGAELGRAESRWDRWGDETLSAISPATTTLRLEVRHLPTASDRGRLRLDVRGTPTAAQADRDEIEFERRLNAALRLYEQEQKEQRVEALRVFRELAAASSGPAQSHRRARALYFAGVTHKLLDDYVQALSTLERSRAAWLEVGDEGWAAEALFEMGDCHALAGRFTEALAHYEEATLVWRRIGARQREAVTLNNKGWVYRRIGEIQLALDAYADSLEIARELGLREQEARGLMNLGAAYRSLGDVERALSHYEASLAAWRELGEPLDEPIILNNMGHCYRHLGQPGRAAEHFERALHMAGELGQVRQQGLYLGSLGRAYLDLDRPRQALEACSRGRDLSARVENRRGEYVSLYCVGMAHRELGELERAETVLEDVRRMSRLAADRGTVASSMVALAEVRRRQGRLLEARELVEQALGIVEAVRTDVDIHSLRASYLAFHRSYYDLEIDVLMDLEEAHPRQGHQIEALRVSERARARSLLELLGEAAPGLQAGVDPALLREQRALRDRMNLLALGEEDRSAELGRLDADLEDVKRRIRSRHPRYAELVDPEPVGLDEIQREVLDEDSVLLEYSLGERRSFLWMVSHRELEVFELAPRAEIERQSLRVHELLSDAEAWRAASPDRHRETFRREAEALSRMVLGAVATRLEDQLLVVAAEGALSYVPFAALPKNPDGKDPRPLVLDHEIVSVPSASVLLASRARPRRRVADRTMLVFADPAFSAYDPRVRRGAESEAAREPLESRPSSLRSLERGGWESFPRLHHSRGEALALTELLPPGEGRTLLGFDATREAALADETGRYRILHFATHGVLDARYPRLSGLVLSLVDETGAFRDGVLRLHDIYEMDLAADLVVLSACRTALGKQLRGEGVIGLTRGFIHAGARGVLASLWNVDDQATAELMTRFYRSLLSERLSSPAALRRAQLELLGGTEESRWRAEYYWAPFVVYGDWRGRYAEALQHRPGASRENAAARSAMR